MWKLSSRAAFRVHIRRDALIEIDVVHKWAPWLRRSLVGRLSQGVDDRRSPSQLRQPSRASKPPKVLSHLGEESAGLST